MVSTRPLYNIRYSPGPITGLRVGYLLGKDTFSKAGKARMASMTDEEKSAHQSMAAKARWNKQKGNNIETIR
jgi:hypothetical protein